MSQTRAETEPRKIEQKIVGMEVVKPDSPPPKFEPYERPPAIDGRTYKIMPGEMKAAVYVTINNLTLPDGKLRAFEIFLNTKDVSHSQWMVAVTRLVSAIMRMPWPFEFMIGELKEVVDPNGGYFLRKGDAVGGRGKVNGIVDHIGRLLEKHCKDFGIIKTEEPAPEVKAALEQKKAEATAKGMQGQTCKKCGQESVYVLDGCLTCVTCGESKCG